MGLGIFCMVEKSLKQKCSLQNILYRLAVYMKKRHRTNLTVLVCNLFVVYSQRIAQIQSSHFRFFSQSFLSFLDRGI